MTTARHGHRTSPCQSCGAPVVWARTTNGKPMPLDPDPNEDGNVLLVGGTAMILGPLDVAALSDPADRERLQVPHFATCTNWKKP